MNHIKQSLGILVAGLASGALLAGSVNINSADVATIAGELKGIGPAKAAAIVATAMFVIGLVLSFALPEPKSQPVEE